MSNSARLQTLSGYAAITAVVLFALFFTRFWQLGADPPSWFHECITDEGWWADSARSKVLFGHYFGDDFGTGYLVTPLYTWALEGLYSVIGFGQVPARTLAAISNTATAGVVGLALFRLGGIWQAIVGVLLLCISPFFWAHGRVALVEPLQVFCMTISLAFWLAARKYRLACFLSGFAMALAVAAKPNAIPLGCFPLFLMIGITYVSERLVLSTPTHSQTRLSSGVFVVLGLVAGIGLMFLVHIAPNWEAFWAMFLSETEAEEKITPRRMLKLPGYIMVSNIVGTWPDIWRVARWSPAVFIGAWLFILAIVVSPKAELRRFAQKMSVEELATAVWLFGTWAAIFASQEDRRFLSMLPSAAILTVFFLWKIPALREHPQTSESIPRSGYIYSLITWLILLLPLMILLKPLIAYGIIILSRNQGWHEGRGYGYEFSGTIFMFFWGFLLIILARYRSAGFAASVFALKRIGMPLILLFALYEASYVAMFLSKPLHTFREYEARLSTMVSPGDVVLGHMASTLFQDLPVMTVRRTGGLDRTPPPNPDVYDRLKPRFIIETRRSNFSPALPLYQDLIRDKNFRSVYRFEAGPVRHGVTRYEFEVFEHPTNKTNGTIVSQLRATRGDPAHKTLIAE